MNVYDATFRKLLAFSALVVFACLLVYGCERQFEPDAPVQQPDPVQSIQLPGVSYRLYFLDNQEYDAGNTNGWSSLQLSTDLDTLRFARGHVVSFWVDASPVGVRAVQTHAVAMRMIDQIQCELPRVHYGEPLRLLWSATDSTAVFPVALRYESQPEVTCLGRLHGSGYIWFEAWSPDLGAYLPKSPPVWIEINENAVNNSPHRKIQIQQFPNN